MRKLKESLPLQIILAVVCGVLLGALFPGGELKALSEVGRVVIHWVKLIAGPFLFLTIVASVVEVKLKASDGLRLVLIAFFNTAIAITLGMGLAHFFLSDIRIEGLAANLSAVKPPEFSLSFAGWIKMLTPSSLFSPFVTNDILLIAILAVMVGVALRKLYAVQGETKLQQISQGFENARALPGILLNWLIHIIPLAVLTVVAGAVSEHGFGIFQSLLKYVAVVLLGFVLQVLLVYGTWIFLVARISPRRFFKETRQCLLYAFGVNSSLATLPLTLVSLRKLGVSNRAASLGAGVATNLNNDGIVLYEALAVYFIAQVSGMPLSESQMLTAALACIVASMGITGIPEAGFISLSVVVSTLGLPAEALPLLLAVDWMLARGRSVVNVLSDMTLSIAMDATEGNVK